MSARLVVDASVLLKWYLRENEQDLDKALLARERYLSGDLELLVPDFAFVEIANRLSRFPGAHHRMIANFFRLFPKRHPLSAEQTLQAFELALRERAHANSRFTVYDALYVVLAARSRTGLLTADEPQAKAARRLGCDVSWLASYK